VTIDVNKTAAILLARTDSMLDIARVLYRYDEGRDDTCQTPARIPKNPADMWFEDITP
jgi:hypothetical protein